jgi:hypothetical protein
MKSAHKSKTVWFGLFLSLLGFVYDNFSILQNVIEPKNYGWILMGVGCAVQVLRYYTDKPIK